jgi:peptidoglycan/xylan/chitin deacetylase (PgdA/CDA1 family)
VKKTAQLIARTLDSFGVLGALERMDNSSGLRVLTYHRVNEPSAEPDLDPGLISATPEEFREQMQLVSEHYHPVSLRTVLAAQRGEASLPSGAVLITFDDGYRDFALHAWPVLRELGLPAVLFVPTAFPDQENCSGFWWDRLFAGLCRTDHRIVDLPDIGNFDISEDAGLRLTLKACKRHVKSLPHSEAMCWVEAALGKLGNVPPLTSVLDWDSLRELAREGLEVCVHGHLHALCTQLTVDELQDDLVTCRSKLASELGDRGVAPVMAWPANACNDQVCEIARDLGFEMAFGGIRGVTQFPVRNALNVMRIPVYRYEGALFRAQLRPAIAGLGRWVAGR